MKKWFPKFLLSFVILLSGYGNAEAHSNQFSDNLYSVILVKRTSDNEQHFDKNHWFETFKRKAYLVDNEETEENFSAIQKQPVKSNYFLNFLGDNKFAVYCTSFAKRVNYCKVFRLLSNKVYLLFQVFRI